MVTDRERIDYLINLYSDKHGVPREYSHAIAHIESRHRHVVDGRIIQSGSGALGVFQLMPSTARGLGVNPKDLEQNIEGGIRYFSQRLELAHGDVPTAIAMYYAGIGNVRRNDALQWEGVQTYIRRFNEFISRNSGKDYITVTTQNMPVQPLTQEPPVPALFYIVLVMILVIFLFGRN